MFYGAFGHTDNDMDEDVRLGRTGEGEEPTIEEKGDNMLRTHCDVCDRVSSHDEPIVEGRYWDEDHEESFPAQQRLGPAPVRMRGEFQAQSGEYLAERRGYEWKAIEICNSCSERLIRKVFDARDEGGKG